MNEGATYRWEQAGRTVTVRIGEGRTITRAGDMGDQGQVRIHPRPMRLPGGRLVLSVNRDRDCHDAEYLMLESTDGGESWAPLADWPTANEAGAHLATDGIGLPDGSAVAVGQELFATDEPGVYALPTWRSADGGRAWGELEAARVELDLGHPFDIYDPPRWLTDHESYAAWAERGFVKDRPPAALEPLRERLGRRRVHTRIALYPAADDELVAMAYLTTRPEARTPHEAVCLHSADGGRSWTHRSTPGPWQTRYESENLLAHSVDGLCEPCLVRRADGSLLCVMRLGSRHPLYAAASDDEGRTWSDPRPLPVWGILPTAVALPGGVLALASGRPHITLSLSLDGGYRWPWTHRFLEDGKPEDASTRNNGLVELAPGRLLYLYDHGGYHAGWEGERRVVAHTVEVAVEAQAHRMKI